MTAAGKKQAAAARVILPAVTAFGRSLARTRNAGPGECAVMALCVYSCLSTLASGVHSTGYTGASQWRREFLEGQAADPDWLGSTSLAAAQRIQDAANVTIPVRAVRPGDYRADLPVMRAASAMRQACSGFDQLALEHRRARTMPQVPEYAEILAALQAVCEPLGAAAAAIGPRLDGIEPDPSSVWCEGFDGNLPAAFGDAARHCRAAGELLGPVRDRAAADVRVWRSRSRARPEP